MAKRERILLATVILLSGGLLPAQDTKLDKKPAAEAVNSGKKMVTYSKSKHEISVERKKKITDIVQQSIKSGKNVFTAEGQKGIEKDVAKVFRMTPAKPIENKSFEELDKIAEKTVETKFSAAAAEKVKAWAEKDSVKRYPMVQPKEHVTFSYKKGPFTRNVDGIFYKANPKNIQVNDMLIPYVDMDETLRAKFDPKFNQDIRTKYVNSVMARFEQQKAKERQKAFEDMLIAQDKTNETNGYLYDQKTEKWITVGEFTTARIKIEQEKIKAARLKQQAARAKAEKEGKVLPDEAEDGTPGSDAAGIDTSNEDAYKKVMEAARDRKKEINGKCSGIDAYQGFDLAVWGNTRMEIAYIFSRAANKKIKFQLTSDLLTCDGENPSSVEFFYNDNILYLVKETYNQMSYDEFMKFRKVCNDRYGLTIEEKENKGKSLFTMITDGKIKAEELHPKDEPAIASLPADTFIFRWKGKETTGILAFKYDSASDAFTDIVFIKENTNVAKKVRADAMQEAAQDAAEKDGE